MTLTERGATGREGPAAPTEADVAVVVLLRFAATLVIVLVGAGALAHFAQPGAERAARAFDRHFGVLGMALGTLLADGLQFPVPPQFYMWLAVASHSPLAPSFAAIASASIGAGGVGYAVSARLARFGWISRKTTRLRRLLTGSFERHGYRAAVLASLLPVPYSVLCYLAGLNRMPLRFLGLLAVCRIPKLAAFYYLIHLGWSIA